MSTLSSPLHPWNLTPPQAIALQNELRDQLEIRPLQSAPQLIAGADISFDIGSDTVYAGIVVLSFPGLEVVEECGIQTTANFPYVPGLLSFREAPAILEVFEKLQNKPDVLVLDGHGTAHPRGFGIACHVGMWLPIATIGCGKTRLCGQFEDLGEARGSHAPLIYKKQVVGAALRTKNKINPVFVSPGNRCDLPGALDLMLRCDGGLKIPEPTRRAHLFVNRLRRGEV
ncbi:Endonuclease V [Abditibacterium utsteinense]|uniref:Endonuclease V n=1 Tax=Abditibacterium utsteinense TaxID=1960156 RepID=A0A2S8STI5_9BACT|nr:endonuclease V [Abditibacterium utsteinense]PQV64107.1 Endonuclease V [Abditibacterium utsteinense]